MYPSHISVFIEENRKKVQEKYIFFSKNVSRQSQNVCIYLLYLIIFKYKYFCQKF